MKKLSDTKRLHLGVIFGTLVSFCQYRIWDGIVEFAKQNDISLTAYFGTYHASDSGYVPHYETCMESIKNNKTLDGIIIIASSVATDMKPESFAKYVKKIPQHLPVVSLGIPISGIPSVLVNSFDGIYTVVNHLIQHHSKRAIAFIKGPEGNWEAEERFKGYKQALEDNGITFNEASVLPGTFLEESGTAAAVELLDNRSFKADAIVASNDTMAWGAMKEFKSRNISVPEDIAVAAFDDDVISWRAAPPITTVRQDFYKMGMLGTQILRDHIDKQPVEKENYLPTVLVVRQSCGCYGGGHHAGKNTDAVPEEADSLLSYTLLKSTPLFPDSVPGEWVSRRITSLIKLLADKNISKPSLRTELNGILSEYKQYSSERYVWCEVLHTLMSGVLVYQDEIDSIQAALSALVDVTAYIQDILHKERQTRDYEENEFRMVISWVTNSLVSSFDIDSLAHELCKSLPQLFIDTALICLYGGRVVNNDPDADRSLSMVLGYDAEKEIKIVHDTPVSALPFDYTSIEGIDFDRERRVLLFYPLFFGEEELGIALLSYDSRMPMDAYAGLRIDISTAVKGASLISKIHALSITDELTGLLNRRGFFRHAGAALKFMTRDKTTQIPIVLFFDLDRLKYINDTYGHKEGDVAISTFARILRSSLRETDVIGRLGGDEFVVFSSIDSISCIGQPEQRLRGKIDEYNAKGLHPYTISASIGSAVLNELTSEALDEAINAADNILYNEKEKKRREHR